ncbi:MAG: hypothetical protein GY705_26120 [Bacteroidetes bacterium]|nr:hypothetical protein [Bacteroidota bacterium]
MKKGILLSFIAQRCRTGRTRETSKYFLPLEFIAAITQHIPEPYFQLIRVYGWYSNRKLEVFQSEFINMLSKINPTEKVGEVEFAYLRKNIASCAQPLCQTFC